MDTILSKLKGLIYEKGYNVSKIAREIGMKESTLVNKFRQETLKAKELRQICEALGFEIHFKEKQ